MGRKKLLVGNWKLHHSQETARDFFKSLNLGLTKPLVDMAIAPTAPMLGFVQSLLPEGVVSLGAQNVFYESKGAFTGEWSAQQLFEIGVRSCIVGHSERRVLFFENDEMVRKKAQACINASIIPIICVGESEQERILGQTHAVIERQVTTVLANQGLTGDNFVVAYEPVWAIGTGKTATKEDAQLIHAFIRSLVEKSLGNHEAAKVRILYGGSVNPLNIREICAMPDVDGALVGGASLQAASFLSMVEELHRDLQGAE